MLLPGLLPDRFANKNKNTLSARIPTRKNSNPRPDLQRDKKSEKPQVSFCLVVPSGKFFRSRPLPEVSAKSWAVFDMNSQLLVQGKKTTRRRQIASLTKIITLLTVLQELKRLDINPHSTFVTISKAAANCQGTTANLQEGALASLCDLMYGMMLPSGNDAATSLAQAVGSLLIQQRCESGIKLKQGNQVRRMKGSVRVFVQKMNQTARTMGTLNSCFSNPHGLADKNNYSSVEDLAKIIFFAQKNQFFKEIVNTKVYLGKLKFKQADSKPLQWQNTNKLLDQKWNGVKTGITPTAGPCLIASFKNRVMGIQINYLVLLLNSESMQHRWQQSRQLLRWSVETRFR